MDWGKIALGLLFLVVIGPAIWVPSLLMARFRAENRRVRALAALIGSSGARAVYIGIGALVSLIGVWFIVLGISSGRAPRSKLVAIAQKQQLVTTEVSRSIALPDGGVINGVAFSPDGQRLLVAGRSLAVCDPATGAVLQAVDLAKLKAPSTTQIDALAASPDGEWIAVGFGNGTTLSSAGAIGRVRWDNLEQIDLLETGKTGVGGVAMSSDGRWAMALPFHGMGRGELPPALTADFEHGDLMFVGSVNQVAEAAFLPNRPVAVLGRADGRIALIDLERSPGGELIGEGASPPRQDRGECGGIAVSADGRFAVTCHVNRGDESIRLWDLSDQSLVYYHELASAPSTVAFPPQADLIAVGSVMEGGITLHDRITGEPMRVLKPPEGERSGIRSIAFSPDGKRIAAASGKRCIVWNLEPTP
jgi:WD40 repeat protein